MKQPLSYVHPAAKIAKTVVIEPFTTIAKDVVIGEGTWTVYYTHLTLPTNREV